MSDSALAKGDTIPALRGDMAPEGDFDSTTHSSPYVLFFYPKDDTPGCTTEASDFSRLFPEFKALGVDVFGISPDSLSKHQKFILKHGLTVPLISDPAHENAEAVGVWVEKSMYGRTYMGIERSSFLVSPSGEILELWRKVRPKGHAEAVLAAAREHF